MNYHLPGGIKDMSGQLGDILITGVVIPRYRWRDETLIGLLDTNTLHRTRSQFLSHKEVRL